MPGGRPQRIQGEHESVLVEIVTSDRMATLDEIARELERRTGVKAHPQTILSTLRRLGLERVASKDAVRIQTRLEQASRYGYSDAHRRLEPGQTYPGCLTDAEWALVKDIFENDGGRGVPPRYGRRQLLDACCHVVRTGASWRMLPKDFPRWQNVYRTFRRWSDQGKFEHMHDCLRAVA